MARLTANLKVTVLTVATAESKAGKEFYQIIGRHSGETLVIGASKDSLPDHPANMAGREIEVPVTIKGDRMDLWLKAE